MCDRKNVRVSKTNRNSNLWQLSHTKNTVVGFGGEWRIFYLSVLKTPFTAAWVPFSSYFSANFAAETKRGENNFRCVFPPSRVGGWTLRARSKTRKTPWRTFLSTRFEVVPPRSRRSCSCRRRPCISG